MNRTTHRRRALRASAVAVALSGAVLALGPATTAHAAPNVDDTRKMSISVDAPTEIGFAGGPVEFTETFGNTGTTFVPEYLSFAAETGTGVLSDSMSLEFRGADGTWEPLALTYNTKYGEFYGRTTETFSVAPGTTQTVHLRIGMPMGTPHHGDTNGGTDHVKLNSALIPEGELMADVDVTNTIKVTPITPSLIGVPVSAAAGGPAIKFGARVTNPTPSEYTNLSHVLFTDKYATVQVFKGGRWVTLSSVANPESDLSQGFYLDGKDITFPANSSATTQVRVSYRADHPAGHAALEDCVIVNEHPGTPSFTGSGMCEPRTALNITSKAGATPTASPSATPTATATPTPTATATPNTGEQLAETGSSSATTAAGIAGGGLLLAGSAVMASVRLRRRSH
ncbi:hypothetical protein OG900_28270 [Streptomyces sp. NBC_00433]